MLSKIKIILCYLVLLAHGGCGVYSFTGAALSPDIRTVSVDNFYNDTPNGPANLSQVFTEKIRDYFQQNTNLVLVQEDGDLQLEGRIIGYDTRDVAPRASGQDDGVDFSSLTRLTIRVQAVYVNTQDDTFDFDQNFSFFSDFDNTRNSLLDIEDALIDEISDQVIIDIFNASVANW